MRNTNGIGRSGSLSTANHTSQTFWIMRTLQCGRIIWRWANFYSSKVIGSLRFDFSAVLGVRFHLLNSRETQGKRKEHKREQRTIVGHRSLGDARGSHAWIRITRIFFPLCPLSRLTPKEDKSSPHDALGLHFRFLIASVVRGCLGHCSYIFRPKINLDQHV